MITDICDADRVEKKSLRFRRLSFLFNADEKVFEVSVVLVVVIEIDKTYRKQFGTRSEVRSFYE